MCRKKGETFLTPLFEVFRRKSGVFAAPLVFPKNKRNARNPFIFNGLEKSVPRPSCLLNYFRTGAIALRDRSMLPFIHNTNDIRMHESFFFTLLFKNKRGTRGTRGTGRS
jgi:hypothetical protein